MYLGRLAVVSQYSLPVCCQTHLCDHKYHLSGKRNFWTSLLGLLTQVSKNDLIEELVLEKRGAGY